VWGVYLYESRLVKTRGRFFDAGEPKGEIEPMLFVEGTIMERLRGSLMVGAATWVVLLSLVCQAALGRDATKLAIRPQKVSAEAGKYSLLPPQASLIDGDAVPWYEKAAKTLPDKKSDDQIRQWLKMPIDQLPADQVEQTLTQYVESFKGVAKAIKCRDCNWPAWKPGTQVANAEEYHRLALGIRLWARLELSRGEYEGAVLAMQTGFGMARQFGQAPALAQLQFGVAIAGTSCREIEELVQMEGSPNLYSALAGFPKPFADVEKAIESEKKAASSPGLLGRLASRQSESVMKPAYDAMRAFVKRLDRDLAALQCIEAIRAYAASHGGQLPQTLAEITDVSVPKDPASGAAFRYSRTGTTAVLESPAPPGGEKREELRYEITVKN
jgi:hypothetical protein